MTRDKNHAMNLPNGLFSPPPAPSFFFVLVSSSCTSAAAADVALASFTNHTVSLPQVVTISLSLSFFHSFSLSLSLSLFAALHCAFYSAVRMLLHSFLV